MLGDSVVVVAVVRTRPRAIPLVMITMRKSIHGFPLLPYMGMGLRLAALRAAGAPLKRKEPVNGLFSCTTTLDQRNVMKCYHSCNNFTVVFGSN